MPNTESVQAYLRAFNERHDVFRTKLDQFWIVLIENNPDNKIAVARELATSLDDLKRILSLNDRPAWIAQLETLLRSMINNPRNPGVVTEAVKTLLNLHPRIVGESWKFRDEAAERAIDYDSVYKKYYDQSRLPELFEDLVRRLQEIVDSGQIDSLRALRGLEKLIATIKRNLKGSFFSVIQTRSFAKSFVRNAFWKVLSDLPMFGSLIEAFEKTLEAMDSEVETLQFRMAEDLRSQTAIDLPMLEVRERPVLALGSPDAVRESSDKGIDDESKL